MSNHEPTISYPAENQIPLALSTDALRSLVIAVLETTGNLPGWPLGRVALQEQEAAKCIGVEPHVLRDARLKKQLLHTRVGRTVTYTSQQLQNALMQLSVNS